MPILQDLVQARPQEASPLDEAAKQGRAASGRGAGRRSSQTAIISKIVPILVPGCFPQMDPSEHAHATHRHHEGTARARQTVKDPVCHMDVDPASAAGSVEHDGRTYYFCSKHCAREVPGGPRSIHGRYQAAAAAPSLPTLDGDPTAGAASQTAARPVHAEPGPRSVIPARCTRRSSATGPGSCPICGMALEPMTVSADDDDDPELVDMSRRFWICLALTVPLLSALDGRDGPGSVVPGVLDGPDPGLDSVRPGGAGGLVGRPAVLRAGLGVARQPQSEYVHADRAGDRDGLCLQCGRRALPRDLSRLVPRPSWRGRRSISSRRR